MTMNKYQEALDWVMEGNDSCGTEWDLLQELVDKATPMKNIGWGCPVCSEFIVDVDDNDTDFEYVRKHNFCPYCGQAIDWREDE